MTEQLKTTKSHLNIDPHKLRAQRRQSTGLDRVKSAYQFASNEGQASSRYTRKLSEVYHDELAAAKQRFLLCKNISDKEYKKIGSSSSLNTDRQSLSQLKDAGSNLELADYLLIQDDGKRMLTMQMNEITNIEYLRKKKHLEFEHKFNARTIDREMAHLRKYLYKLQVARDIDSGSAQSLKRMCRGMPDHRLQQVAHGAEPGVAEENR